MIHFSFLWASIVLTWFSYWHMEKVLMFWPSFCVPVSDMLGHSDFDTVHLLTLCDSLPYISAHFPYSFLTYPLFKTDDLNWFIFRVTASFTSQLKYTYIFSSSSGFFISVPILVNFRISFCLPIVCLYCCSLFCESLLS